MALATAPAMPLPFLFYVVFDGRFLLLLSFFCWHCSVVFLGGEWVALVYYLDSTELSNLTPEGLS